MVSHTTRLVCYAIPLCLGPYLYLSIYLSIYLYLYQQCYRIFLFSILGPISAAQWESRAAAGRYQLDRSRP